MVQLPDGLAAPVHTSGPPFMKCGWNFTHGNMKKGGTVLPIAFTPSTIVTRIPRSLDDIRPTYFAALRLNTRSGVWIVVTPVSSMFHTLATSKLWRAYTIFRLKNITAFVLLNTVARCTLVDPCWRVKPLHSCNFNFLPIGHWNFQMQCKLIR